MRKLVGFYFSYFITSIARTVNCHMMRTYLCTFVYTVEGPRFMLRANAQSSVLKGFEVFLFGCSTSSLPDNPFEVFATNMIWVRSDQVENIMVCGRADWKSAYQQCYSWNPRKDQFLDDSLNHFFKIYGSQSPV